MCRLFGIMANKDVDIRFSMLEASNRFKSQGKNNPHGWGIGWYEHQKPKIEKYGENAFYSERFDELSKEIKSNIVIAHVRYSTSGSANSDRNAHPFVYKNWIFAHNGTINRDRIIKMLRPPYNQSFTSEPIDSEVYFRFIIQSMEDKSDIINGIKDAVKHIISDAKGANFILSEGQNIYAFKYKRELFYLLRDPASPLYVLSEETAALVESKRLFSERACLIATEKLTKENWQNLSDGEFLFVDRGLQIKKESLL